MRLHLWSRRTLALVWLAGLLAEGMLVAAAVLQGRRERARTVAEWERRFGVSRQPTPAERDSILARVRAAGVTTTMRGDTIVGLNLSPEAQGEVRKFGEAFTQVGRAMGPALATLVVLALVVYGAIPASLIVLTAFWVRSKRRAAGGALAA